MNSQAVPLDRKLSKAQVEEFLQEGFLILNDVFEPNDLEPLRNEIAGFVDARANELQQQGKLKQLYAGESVDRRLARIYQDSPENGDAIIAAMLGRHGGGYTGREMFNVITHPKLLRVMESIVGPEIVGSSVFRVRPKVPDRSGGVVPWHQDSGYLLSQCDNQLVVTCWLPLVDSNVANGCMQVLPRAHRQGILTHHTGGNAGFLVVKDTDLPFPAEKAVTAEVPKGGVVLMTNMTPHCSTPNHSDIVRWSIDLRYQSASVPNNVGLWPDLGDQEEVEKIQMACYPPEADFIVQSRKNPVSVSDYNAFLERRNKYEKAKNLFHPGRGWKPASSTVAA